MRYALSAASIRSRPRAVWLGSVEALDETTAMKKAAAEFKVLVAGLMAIRV
jgi:hypothetical protein